MAPRKRKQASVESSGTTLTCGPSAPRSNKALKSDPANIEILQQVYGITFPETLLSMWNFCCEFSKDEPLKALSCADLYLVGPFEILSKDAAIDAIDPITYHLHWRFYYDPPETMTVLVSGNPNKDPYHIGLLRDDPKDEKCIVVSNSGEDCKIEVMGDNLFCAVKKVLSNRSSETKGKGRTAMQRLLKRLEEYAKKHGIDANANCLVEERQKQIVDPTFHGAGIVVPIDENEVGYRPVGETPTRLKKMFKRIDEAPNDEVRMEAFDNLQEIISFVQLANDEYDFGMGLELGMQMFCFGSRYLNKAAGRMLSMAYQLLKRDLYQKIIEKHLSDRRKENYSHFPDTR